LSALGNSQVTDKTKKEADLNKFQELLKKSNFLKAGLKAAPYIGGAFEILNFFIGGGKSSGPQEVKLMPLAVQADVSINGTISSRPLYDEIVFFTPGSLNSETRFVGNYPHYNEVLGVFNFLETPKLAYKEERTRTYCVWGQSNNCETLPYGITVKMEDFDYVINPKTTTQTPEIQAAIHFQFDAPQTPMFINSNGNADSQLLIYLGNGLYRTGYMPVDCISEFAVGFQDGTSFNSVFDRPNPFPEEIYIKVMVNIPTSSNQQNTLFMATYPMEFELDNSITYAGRYTDIDGVGLYFANTTITSDVLSWRDIVIANNVTISPGVRIIGAEGVELAAGTTLPTGVTISTEL